MQAAKRFNTNNSQTTKAEVKSPTTDKRTNTLCSVFTTSFGVAKPVFPHVFHFDESLSTDNAFGKTLINNSQPLRRTGTASGTLTLSVSTKVIDPIIGFHGSARVKSRSIAYF